MIAPTECPDRGIVAQESEVRHRSETEIRGLRTGGESPGIVVLLSHSSPPPSSQP